jgi:PKD domain/Secretion system C-terminal sorting domain
MKNLFIIAALIIGSFANAYAANHNFTPNRNIVAKGKTTVYFVAENPEKYDWVKWNFGDGQMEYAINPAHVYDKIGVYDVKMIVSKGAQIDTFCKKAFVTILPGGGKQDGGIAYNESHSKLEYNKFLNDGSKDQLNEVIDEKIQAAQTNEKINVAINMDNNILIANKSLNTGSIEVRDINGNMFIQSNLETNEDIKTLETQNLPKGLYLVSIATNNRVQTAKVYIR